ncbi:MAG: DNA primase [Verrucomicrobia bacterium]|nr:DNA primase [Verrucomicrobiota bacterium]
MPGLIPDHVLDQIRHANDIVDVVGSRMPDLKRAGGAFKALCPFHKEKTPSFQVNPQRQLFKCFGCGVGGDVFKFVMLWDRLTFPEAVEQLARKAGIALEFSASRDRGASGQKELLFKLHSDAAGFFHTQLMKEPPAQIARDYLTKRKVSADAAKEFMLGYSPDAWDAVLQWGASRKYPPQLLEEAGLVIQREGGGYYDRFRGRLMFPIRDESGRTIGFSGRVLAGDEKTAKYVNTPETPIFTKGRVLYGLDKTKRAIIEAKQAIVCEGQLDLIACYTAGVQNVVAPQGTAFTGDHGRILKRYCDEVVLCFDSDAAGQNAAVRSVDELLAAGLVVKVVTMPAGHDPDSLVREEGADRLREVVSGARAFFDFHLDYLCTRHNPQGDTGRVQISRALAESLAKVANAVLRATYIQRSAARLGVPEAALREEIAKVRRRFERADDVEPTEPEPEGEAPAKPAPSPAEKMLLQLALGSPETLAPACEALDAQWLTASVAGEMLAHIRRLHAAGQWRGEDQLLDEFPDAQDLLAELAVGFRPPANPSAAALDCVRALQKRWAQGCTETLRRQLAQPGLTPAEIARIQKQILDLK